MPPASDQDEQPLRHDVTAAAPDIPQATVDLVLTAEWVTPSIARDHTRRWLAAHHWPPAPLDELVLAVSEAVSNTIEHGYLIQPEFGGEDGEDGERPDPGSGNNLVELHGVLITDPDGTRSVELTIRDHGRWLEPVRSDRRGHGMSIMRACADEFTVDGTDHGTTVHLRSRPFPPSLDATTPPG